MAAPRVVAFVMAGGQGVRLLPFTAEQPKPALPFAGTHRVIDFVLSNLYNSGIRSVFVLLQYKPQALLAHLEKNWAFARREPGEFIVPVLPSDRFGGEFKGTADAVRQSLDLIEDLRADVVAVFAADHVYRMDVRQMVSFHGSHRADASIAALPFPIARAHELGVIRVDASARVIDFQEKPRVPAPMPGDAGRALVSMGNYLFRPEALRTALAAAARLRQHDFGHHVIPRMIDTHRVYAYDFMDNVVPGTTAREERGYWRDVGTIEAYAAAQGDLLGPQPKLSLDNPQWPIHAGQAPRGAWALTLLPSLDCVGAPAPPERSTAHAA